MAQSTEKNDRYYAKHGHGFGPVLDHGWSAPLKTLTVEQIDALVNVALLGDIDEIGIDEDTLGVFAVEPDNDLEVDVRQQLAAAIVYLSGHLAGDIPSLSGR